jgi:hypothetical protein
MPSQRPSPTSSPSSEPRFEGEAPSLVDLYKFALDEYRFQVNLNWNRSQYYIVLNLGILGVATGLLKVADERISASISIGLYIAGVVCCVLSLAAGRVQQGYYLATRNHKRRLEELLDLGDLAIRTTPGMGSTTRRLGKVTTFHTLIISILLCLDLLGLVYSSGLGGDHAESDHGRQRSEQTSSQHTVAEDFRWSGFAGYQLE